MGCNKYIFENLLFNVNKKKMVGFGIGIMVEHNNANFLKSSYFSNITTVKKHKFVFYLLTSTIFNWQYCFFPEQVDCALEHPHNQLQNLSDKKWRCRSEKRSYLQKQCTYIAETSCRHRSHVYQGLEFFLLRLCKVLIE